MNKKIKIDKSWLIHIESEFKKSYMIEIKKNLIEQKKAGRIIYPKNNEIFNSINLTKFEKTKVIIIGQDPYHGEGQAHGLSFSVKGGIKIPPSLLNIFKEIESDTGILVDKKNGDLTRWATQGVLLLNSLLTVEKGNPLSHKNFGWEFLTDRLIQILSEKRLNLDDHKKIELELNKASSFIRNQLAKNIHLKRLPALKFTYDSTEENSLKIENLIKKLPK